MTALAQRLKLSVAKTLCHPSLGAIVAWALGNRIPSGHCVIDTGDLAISQSTKASIFFGFYEGAEIRFVERYLPASADVVDLGASAGVVSAHIARLLKPGRTLVCVEPNAALINCVERNVHGNGPGVVLELIHGAIDCEAVGRTTSFKTAEVPTCSRLAQRGECGESVPRVRLADLLRTRNLNAPVLVCDIEGAEAGLLEEEAMALKEFQMIIIELHATEFRGRHVSVEDMVSAVVKLGFRLVDRRGPVCVFVRGEP